MNYRQDKKKSNIKVVTFILVAIFLFIFIFGSAMMYSSFSGSSLFLSKPFFTFGQNISARFSSWGTYFESKKSINSENEKLKLENMELSARLSNYQILENENKELKEIFERKGNRNFILGNILVKPNRSLYDTLILDVGENMGVKVGQKVYAYGYVPLGYVGEVYDNTSKIILYSTSREKVDVIVSSSGTTLSASGRGNGNFEMILPRDFDISVGEVIYLPGTVQTLATVSGIISDPRDSFKKALLKSPVNIFELRFVEVEK